MDLVLYALILVSGAAVVKIIYELLNSTKHLTQEEISRYRTKKLSRTELNRVTSHLGKCIVCQKKMME